MNTYIGHHTTLDLYDCNTEKINSTDFVKKTLLAVAKLLNMTVVNATIHAFSPIGISGVVIIEESHIAIHTWPEYKYVAIDFFTYEKTQNLDKGISFLQGAFEAQKTDTNKINRGNMKHLLKKQVQ